MAGDVPRPLYINLFEIVADEGRLDEWRIGIWDAISAEFGIEFSKLTFNGREVG